MSPDRRPLALLTALLFAAGCGGSGGDDPVAPNALRVSAASATNATTSAFVAVQVTRYAAGTNVGVLARDATLARSLRIVLPAGAAGSYVLTDPNAGVSPGSGSGASVVYGQDLPGTKPGTAVAGTWTAAGGTVTVLALSSTGMQARLAGVRLVALPGTGASGSITLDGTFAYEQTP